MLASSLRRSFSLSIASRPRSKSMPIFHFVSCVSIAHHVRPYTDHVYASKSKKTAIAVSTSPPSSPPSTPIKSSSATLSTSPRFSLQQQQQIPFGISKTADAVSSFSPKHLVTKTSRAFGASKSFLHSAAL